MAGLTTIPHVQSTAPRDGWLSRRGRLSLMGLMLSTILLQRLAIPAGDFTLPAILPLGLAVIGYLVVVGDLRPAGSRLALFLAAAGALAASAYLAARYSTQVRISALLVVLAVWAPWALRAAGDDAERLAGFRRMGVLYVRTMIVLALVGVAQIGLQLLGVWRYRDVVMDTVPPQFLVPDYNTSIPMAYESPIYKAQAFVFVEPSTFSQFVAVAIVVAILLRAPLWQVTVLALGLISALSGTGLLLLGVGVLLLMVRAPAVIRPLYVVAAALALSAALATPAFDVYSARTAELESETSSLALRFVLPYDEVADGLDRDTRRWVTGAGPGASDRVLESAQVRAGLAVVYTIPAKALFEYGLPAALVFLAFVLVSLFRCAPVVALPGTMLVWLLFMGGYLAIPHTVWAVWLLSPVWSRRE
jgi:hypothetical protein